MNETRLTQGPSKGPEGTKLGHGCNFHKHQGVAFVKKGSHDSNNDNKNVCEIKK